MDTAGIAVRNWQLTTILFLFLIALGVQSWLTIPRAEDPSYDAPSFGVVAVLPGAPPGEVESLVVDPLETRVRGLSDIDRVQAKIAEGVALLVVDFVVEADVEDRHSALLREVEAARGELPADIQRLEVIEYEPGTVTVLQLAVVGETASMADLRAAAKAVEEAAEGVDGVRGADLDGLPEERVDVAVDTDRMAALGLPADAVFKALMENDARIPGGHVEIGDRRFTVSADATWDSPEQIGEAPLVSAMGQVVRVQDVATVTRRHALADTFARFQGRRAVWVSVMMKDGANVFAVNDGVRAAAEALQLPPGVTLEVAFDQSVNVGHRLDGFMRDFGLAIALVLLTLLPLGLRASAVVMVSIPLSLAVGLAGLQAAGFSVNQLSIVGFVISLGLLVDDAIVVIENISRHLREGKSPMDAAIEGTREIGLAVVGCTATLLLAFLPLVFMPGPAGMFIRSMPMAVVFTVLASLGISLTIVPLMSRFVLVPEEEHGNFFLRAMTGVIERTYRPVLDRAIRWPRTTVALAALLFAGSVALVPVIGFSLFPKAAIPQVRVLIDAGQGAAIGSTDAAARFVEAELSRHPEVVATMTTVGGGNPRVYYNVGEELPDASLAEVFFRIDAYEPEATPAMFDELRAVFATWPGARITLKEFENGPPVDAPVAVRLLADDLDDLRAAASLVAEQLKARPALTDVHNPLSALRTDLSVHIDRDEAGLQGVPINQIARLTRFALAGLEVGKLRDAAGDELPIVARVAGEGQPGLDRLDRLAVTGSAGTLPLAEVTDVAFTSGPARLTHVNGTRSALVAADVVTGANIAREASAVEATMRALPLPAGVRWEMGGEAESSAKTFDGIGTAALIAAFGILAVLILEFGTFRSTAVVLSVIPLGVTGGVGALWATGNTLSFTAAIGFVALVGIEVKNSILLVDLANQLRRGGLSLDDGIARAGEVRFVPILLTTATALGGLLPLAFEGSPLYSPLAIVIIGGLISSTVLTRLVTPVVYKMLAPTIDLDPGVAHG